MPDLAEERAHILEAVRDLDHTILDCRQRREQLLARLAELGEQPDAIGAHDE